MVTVIKAHQRGRELEMPTELSHAGPETLANPRLPGEPEALPGVDFSDLVRPRHINPNQTSIMLSHISGKACAPSQAECSQYGKPDSKRRR